MKNDNCQIQTLSTDLDASSSSTSLSSSLVCEKPFSRANNHFNFKIPRFTKSIRNVLEGGSLRRNDQRLNVIEVVSDHMYDVMR